ncbi:carbon-nitrogen hydrolase [Scenedesmus sp. NREL 46B-D3]|nr:carbon-nitrogen hydrolase [Scenedesmus sp. NREL 46B-D3]
MLQYAVPSLSISRHCSSLLLSLATRRTGARHGRRFCSKMSQAQDVSAAAAAAAAAASPAGRRCKVAVAQMTSVGDQLANFNTCKQLAEQAAAAGCSMLFLPECFSFIGASQPEVRAALTCQGPHSAAAAATAAAAAAAAALGSLSKAEPLDGPAMARYRQLARDTGLWLSLGGFQEMGPDLQHLYNAHVVLDAAGSTAASYRKVHLFDVDVPNGPVLMESRTTAPGDKSSAAAAAQRCAAWLDVGFEPATPGCQLVVCDSPAGRLGLTVCYDLRFPEVYQTLTWGMGAEVLLVPSAFTKVTGKAHWEVLLRARAIECQCFVIAAAQAGVHNEKRESYGHALIIDPGATSSAGWKTRKPRALLLLSWTLS